LKSRSGRLHDLAEKHGKDLGERCVLSDSLSMWVETALCSL